MILECILNCLLKHLKITEYLQIGVVKYILFKASIMMCKKKMI